VTNFQTDSNLELDPQDPETSEFTRDLPLQVPSITNSPRCAPSQPLKPDAPRRVRPVRVDAWAVPASANWSRTRTTIRKVKPGTRSTDWALPF
jgi:hypothetical protein